MPKQKLCKYCNDPLTKWDRTQCATCRSLQDESTILEHDPLRPYVIPKELGALKALGFRGSQLHNKLVAKYPQLAPHLTAIREHPVPANATRYHPPQKPVKVCKYCQEPVPPRGQIQCGTCKTLKAEAYSQGFYDEVVAEMERLAGEGVTGEALYTATAEKYPAIEPRLWALRQATVSRGE
jgi:hypothetical protein